MQHIQVRVNIIFYVVLLQDTEICHSYYLRILKSATLKSSSKSTANKLPTRARLLHVMRRNTSLPDMIAAEEEQQNWHNRMRG